MRLIFTLFLLVFSSNLIFSQMSPIGNSGSTMTAYTNGTTNDPIYIWCGTTLGQTNASLTATPPSGTGPWTFEWFYHNEANFSWTSYFSETGNTSTINNLPSDGYRVQIFDNNGVQVGCYTAWVWNMNTEVLTSETPTACNGSNLNGTINTEGQLVYYNPPPPESLIDVNTTVTVCFSANHTYVSDLAFYLVGPPSCGSPRVLLSPNPGANGQGSICNSNNNVNNLCFTTTPGANFDPCNQQSCGLFTLATDCQSNYTGTYSTYGPAGSPTTINWSPIYGCNASVGGWAVQIYDCIGADIGSLTNATITFSNLPSFCGSPTSITYNSGNINSAINDNSCDAGTASIFQVPVSTDYTTPITLNANVTYEWTSNPAVTIPNATSSLTPSITDLPDGNTAFTLTATTTFGTTSCQSTSSLVFNSNCCEISADAGSDISVCSNQPVTIGTSGNPAYTYSWSPTTGLDNAGIAQPTVSVSNSGNDPIQITYTLSVTNPENGGCTETDNITVTINPTPNLVVPQNLQVCPGECTTLNVSGADFYAWSPQSAFTDPTSASPSVCPTATTTYTVTGYKAAANSVVNGDFSAGATGFTSDYLFSADTQPEGTYFVSTDASLTHPSFVGVDHTTGDGNFMVVNGAGTANSSVWCQNVPVQQNTDYVFSTWVSTLAVGSPAILQFSINGNVLGNPFTAPDNTNEWLEFYSTWNSGTSTSAAICIVNQNTNIGGNDFGLDDIYFAALCTSTETVTVQVNPLPPVNAGSDVSVCQGQNVTLTASGATAYSWTNNVVNGESFTPSSTTTYTVTGTDGNGCSNTDQVLVTVNALPTVNAGQDATICAGQPVTLTATGASTYSWNNSITNGVPFNPTSTTTYTVTGTDANGCQNIDQVLVTVNQLPNVNGGPDIAVCDGESVTLTASGAATYSWNNDISNGVAFTPTATTTYTVTGTSNNGCTNTDQVVVTVNSIPTINAGADVTICAGSSVVLNASGGTTYVWSSGTSNGGSVSPSTTTTYTVTGTTAAGCSNTDEITVTVLPVPNASFTADEITGYPVHTVNFTNNSTNANNYTWSFGNGIIIPATNTTSQTTSYSETGIYEVILFASNGICSDSTSIQVIVLPFPDAIIYVPNVFTPNGDNNNDEWFIDAKFASNINVQIFNRWGNLMLEMDDLTDKWDGKIGGNDASAGVYFYKYIITDLNNKEYTGHGNFTLVR
jgi:trimeric autotransporter adhesin